MSEHPPRHDAPGFLAKPRGPMLWRGGAVLLVAALLGAALVYQQQQEPPLRVSGFIEADEIRVGSRVGGRVQQVAVEEGSRVAPGELLVVLEAFDLRERLAETEAMVAQRRRTLEKLQAGFRAEEIAQAEAHHDELRAHLTKLQNGPRPQELAAARAEVDLAKANLGFAEAQKTRVAQLVTTGAASREEFDQATKALEVAQSELQVAKEKLSLLEAGTRPEEIEQAKAQVREAQQAWLLKRNGYRSEEIAEAQAAVEAAEATRQSIQQQIEELKILAPAEAIVDAVELEPGDLVPANTPALALTVLNKLWVRAYVPEDELDLEIGQAVDVTVDSYPDHLFQGTISFIAQQGEFTPSNVQTPDERSQQVFRMKVLLNDPRRLLRPGMAADVWLEKRGDER